MDYLLHNATLRIDEVQVEDEGRYACVILLFDASGGGNGGDDDHVAEPKRRWTKLIVNGEFNFLFFDRFMQNLKRNRLKNSLTAFSI